MEVKDTVMSDREIEDRLDYLATNSHDVNGNYIPKCKVVDKLYGESTMATPFEAAKHIAKAQAEISFKAGYKYALEGAVMDGAYDSIKKLGIKEVAEWIEASKYKSRYLEGDVMFAVEGWQAKLKEWGINVK